MSLCYIDIRPDGGSLVLKRSLISSLSGVYTAAIFMGEWHRYGVLDIHPPRIGGGGGGGGDLNRR